MVEVRKRKGEGIESMVRRFARRVQHSGLLFMARKAMFYERPKSKRRLREEAIKRSEFRAEKEKLKKLGLEDKHEFRRKNFKRP